MSFDDSSNKKNAYLIDIENGAEATRLIDQDALFTKSMGGIFPEQDADFFAQTILDLACGPGEWATEVAFQYPDATIIGIDNNPKILQYAQALAQIQHHEHISFKTADVKESLPFNADFFDLVNGRLLVGFMDQASWPQLLRECWRVLKPGGILRLTEIDVSISNSSALQRLNALSYQALASQRRTFSVDSHSFGIAYILGKLFKEAGFHSIQKRSFHLDGSYGAPFYQGFRRDGEMFFPLLKPFLLRLQIVEEPEFDALYEQLLLDVYREDFASITYGLTVWGRK